MIIILMDGPKTYALNMGNVTTVEFERDGATILFTGGIAAEGQREGEFRFQPDTMRIGVEASRYLWRTLLASATVPPYGKEYPGTTRKEIQ